MFEHSADVKRSKLSAPVPQEYAIGMAAFLT
jgi:hypothetical protein